MKQPSQAPEQGTKPIQQHPPQKCPRCESLNTKFCYYNNYSLSQPRYFCKTCRRYWTQGGTLRNVPVGGSCRKGKRPRMSSLSATSSSPTSLQTQKQQTDMESSNPHISADAPVLKGKDQGDDIVGSYSNYQAGGNFFSLAAIPNQPVNYPQGLITSTQSSINQTASTSGRSSSNLDLLRGYAKFNLNPSPQIHDQHQFYQMGVGNFDQKGSHVVNNPVIYPSESSSASHADQEKPIWTQSFINTMSFKNRNNSGNSNNDMNKNTAGSSPPSLNPNQWSDDHLPGYGSP